MILPEMSHFLAEISLWQNIASALLKTKIISIFSVVKFNEYLV